MASSKEVYQVAVVVYDGVDILDFAGPVEMLSHVSHVSHVPDPVNREPAFSTHIMAATPTIHAGGALTITTDMTFEEAAKKLDDFDVLIVPGGAPSVIQGLIDSESPELQWIRQFATHTSQRQARVILSVCTGALLLGATGTVEGLTLTTHHLAYDILREVCEKAAGGKEAAKVVTSNAQRRYVDGGVNAAGVRVVTAGGVTCGLDASLYIAEMKVGKEAAEFVAKLTEHEWKRAV